MRHLSPRRLVLYALASALCSAIAIVLGIWLTLPGTDALHTRARAPSTRIVDANGRLLYEFIDPRDPEAGHHSPLPIERIPRHLINATIAVEDASFYDNPGVDLLGIARAMWINLRGGEARAGGSTITQQLARMLLFDAEERQSRTLLRKTREALLAWDITRRYSKDEILTLYLNEAYYGNLAYGVDAAARAYFGKSADALDLAESAFLAGLPQAPAAYDPFSALELARKRQAIVLDLMRRNGMISAEEAALAGSTRLSLAPAPYPIRAPHFVAYVRRSVERDFGTETLLRAGLTITTTLDLSLDEGARDALRAHLGRLGADTDGPAHNANNAAVVVIDPRTGAIRAMVGSPNYFDGAISGAVNATVALRQPGSAIKPLTYAAAFESVPGFTAASPLFDVRTAFPTREGLPYVPINYDRRFHGPVSARAALATSNNVAAVATLQQVGLKRALRLATDLGVHSLADADRYGLALTLGGGEVRLLELTAALGAFGNGGARVDPYAISEIRDASGALLLRRERRAPEIVVDPRVAWLVSDILADNAARAPAFGEASVLRLPWPAAVKTGTTTDFRDNWTIGYTPNLAVGVWVGNADGAPMQAISGVSGAGPIWRDVMLLAHRGEAVPPFARPPGMRRLTVCALSGLLPSPDCPLTRDEWFLDSSLPAGQDTWHRRAEGRLTFVLPVALRRWAREQGWPVSEERSADASVSVNADVSGVRLMRPDDGARIKIDRMLPRASQRLEIDARTTGLDAVRIDILRADGAVVAAIDGAGGVVFWPLTAGDHVLRARAYLRDGAFVDSAPVRVLVIE
jgi:penicillin-binding protein 1C